MFNDPKPNKITLAEWSKQFRLIDAATIKKYIYYKNVEWGVYLSPPATFMVYGARELKRLKLDNSMACLRLWGFVFNETERLFRARQAGKKVIATLGDLGTVPVIVQAFPNCIAFYPECIWWTPFFKESTELLETAHALGIPEAACFSKAALAAFYKRAYFPIPDLIFASTGATCDDYSCVAQLIEDLGHDINWLEVPLRRKWRSYFADNEYENKEYPARFEGYLIEEYKKVWQKMVELTGVNELVLLEKSIKKTNRLRKLVEAIKKLSFEAEVAPLPGLELMTIEFGNLYGYADIDEWLDIIEMVYSMVKERVEKNIGVLKSDAVPIAWVTPSADPLLLNLVEELGGRVAATEYVINQALVNIEEGFEPYRALARSFLQASLIGSTEERIRRIIEGVKEKKIAGVLITNMLGASHCAMETRLIEQMIKDVPVLSIDVPAPFGITEQMKTRIAAFLETIR